MRGTRCEVGGALAPNSFLITA